ncbi:MAG: hypothetical protein ACYDBH_00975 [Acidobacteriaceae bacterium]
MARPFEIAIAAALSARMAAAMAIPAPVPVAIAPENGRILAAMESVNSLAGAGIAEIAVPETGPKPSI